MVINKALENMTVEQLLARAEELRRLERCELAKLRKLKKELKKAGLLTNFIFNKKDTYVEPSRKGTPKGDPIGFSKVKYHAALLMLTDRSLKEIAHLIGVSYGLIQKWRTEPEFIRVTILCATEFSDLFIEVLRKAAKRDAAFYDKFIRKAPIQKLETGKIKYPLVGELSDLPSYGSFLRFFIIENLVPAAKGDAALTSWALRLIDFFKIHPAKHQWKRGEILSSEKKRHKLRKPLTEKRQELRKRVLDSMLADVIQLLKKTEITDVEKRHAIFALATVRKQSDLGVRT